MGRLLVVATATALLVVGVTVGPSAAQSCRATPSSPLDRDYRSGAPVRTSVGKGHVLTGIVRSSHDCKPIGRAKVELWQQGPNGVYSDGIRSKAWRATVFTRANGSYRFEGPIPRSTFPHIHIRVTTRTHQPLNVTYALSPGAKRGRLDLVLVPAL